MKSFVFQNSTKVYFGTDSVSKYLPGLLAQYGSKVMLTYGGGSIKKTGIYDEIMGYLKAAGKTVVEFYGIRSNPTYAKVLEGAALAKKEKVDLILAVGGGSVMDCSKAIALGAVYDGDLWNDYWALPFDVLHCKTRGWLTGPARQSCAWRAAMPAPTAARTVRRQRPIR